MNKKFLLKICDYIPPDDDGEDDHKSKGAVYVDFDQVEKIEFWPYCEFVFYPHFYFYIKGKQYKTKDFKTDAEAMKWLSRFVEIRE